MPRSERRRYSGGGTASAASAVTGEMLGDGHTHQNLSVLDQLSKIDEGYLYRRETTFTEEERTDEETGEKYTETVKTETDYKLNAGLADVAKDLTEDSKVWNLVLRKDKEDETNFLIAFNKGLKIGDAIISWDSENGALKVSKSMYSEGAVSAMGIGNSSGGSSDALTNEPLTINFNGATQLSYDGSAAKTLNITPAAIGAAASIHTHSQYATGIDIGDGAGRPASGGMLTIPAYVPMSGGEFTGDVTVPYLISVDGIESGGSVQATGFKVEGSSDANIVLAGGGTKAVSYFATAGHTHSYVPLSGGTITGALTCNQDLRSNYLKSNNGASEIFIGDIENEAYVTFVEDMCGHNPEDGSSTWEIWRNGSATFNDITTSTMRVNDTLEAKKIFTDNIKTSASGLKVQKSDYVTAYAQIGPSGQIELYAGTPFIDFHYNNSTSSDYSTRIVCDTATRLSVLATTLRASNAITCVSLTQTSDERLKDNIKDIDEEFIKKIFSTDNGFIHQFDFKESGKHSNGIIAQEVKDIMPEVVDYDETDDVYRVDYTSASMKLIGAMFKKMKQMQIEIDKLKEMNSNK